MSNLIHVPMCASIEMVLLSKLNTSKHKSVIDEDGIIDRVRLAIATHTLDCDYTGLNRVISNGRSLR